MTEVLYEQIYTALGLKYVNVELDDYKTEQTTYQEAQVKYFSHGKQVVSTTYTADYNGKTYVFAFVTVSAAQSRTIDTIMKSVVLEQSTYSATGFADIKGHWAEASVQTAVEKDLFSGTSASTFSPDAPMTRAMLVQVLYRMAGAPKTEPAEFADVTADDWFANAVAWAAKNNIVQGSDGKFDPNGILTREQLATILWRYAKYDKRDVSIGENTNILSYNDAFDIAKYAIPAFQWTCGAGLMQGLEVGYLVPQGATTRAQVAAVLVRYLDK